MGKHWGMSSDWEIGVELDQKVSRALPVFTLKIITIIKNVVNLSTDPNNF